MKTCPNYCGISCIDGSCPIALQEEYSEQGCDTIKSCDECYRNNGCDDCAWEDTELCFTNTPN